MKEGGKLAQGVFRVSFSDSQWQELEGTQTKMCRKTGGGVHVQRGWNTFSLWDQLTVHLRLDQKEKNVDSIVGECDERESDQLVQRTIRENEGGGKMRKAGLMEKTDRH